MVEVAKSPYNFISFFSFFDTTQTKAHIFETFLSLINFIKFLIGLTLEIFSIKYEGFSNINYIGSYSLDVKFVKIAYKFHRNFCEI